MTFTSILAFSARGGWWSGLLDAKQLSGLNYYLGGKGERVRWRIPLSFCYLAGWRGLANRAGFQATPLPAL